jgi:lipid II:glycine glycyltransferase (peptidoglycan interpeptide bridge formation enzyme)
MKDSLLIRIARKDKTPAAAMLTLKKGASVVYKYGCSNEKFHNLGGMPFLFWKLIEESKISGVERIDLGRTDMGNGGLISFKDRLGASKKLLIYYRYSKASKQSVASLSDSPGLRRFFALLPDAFCSAAGKALYKHLG